MRRFKSFFITICDTLVFMGATGLVLPPSIYGKNNPPQEEVDDSPGQGDQHRADPCDHLPNAPGKAKRHDKHCPPLGSSGGVAKGDFNGDGFGDLAIGVPFEDIEVFIVNPITGAVLLNTAANAGAVNIIYGSANGLTTTDPNVPPSQFWSQNSPGILDSSEANDNFGWSLAAGDFNRDGFSDLAIGVPGEDVVNSAGINVQDAGAVNVIYGLFLTQDIQLNPFVGLDATGDQLWHQGSSGMTGGLEANDQFGRALY